MTIQLIELYDASPLGYIKVRLFQEPSSNSVPGFRAWASNCRMTRTTGCAVRNGGPGCLRRSFRTKGNTCGIALDRCFGRLPVCGSGCTVVYGGFLLNSISLLFRRVFIGSTTIHSKEENMNEYVAGGFPFRKGHERESVEGVAGLYRDCAVWIFPVPEIPEKKAKANM